MFAQEWTEKSYDEMRQEMEALLAEATRLKEESLEMVKGSDDLRERAVEARRVDVELAEALWQEAEDLRFQARDKMRQAVDNRIRAADIKHRLDVHDQIEAVSDEATKLWRRAVSREI
jgi:uncharacterized protein (DUF849 family)